MQTALARKNRSPSRFEAPAPALARAHASVRHILRGSHVQPKLKIGAANDPAEREADRVMRMPMPGPGISGLSASGKSIQRMCAGCEDELQRKEAPGATPALGVLSEGAIRGLRGGGTPLPASERAFFEPRFGQDFSGVRVHSGPTAHNAASAINARAFTLGSDIAFARGEYAPGTAPGRRLLAHELAHVGQQGNAAGQTHRNIIQRACGRAIKAPEACIESGGDITEFGTSSRDIFLFNRSCDDLAPGEQTRLEDEARTRFMPSQAILAHGFASEEGNPVFNKHLSCARANTAIRIIRAASGADALPVRHGATPGDKVSRRSVVIEEIGGAPLNETREPSSAEQAPDVPSKSSKRCKQAYRGFRPSTANCRIYARNSWWLPLAYVRNAQCACLETPNSPTANCVREFLQRRMLGSPRRLKSLSASKKHLEFSINPLEHLYNHARYQKFVQTTLTPRIYKDHVDAYRECCCPSGPAPYISWIGVTTVPMPFCSMVGEAIRQFGSCHGTSGKW